MRITKTRIDKNTDTVTLLRALRYFRIRKWITIDRHSRAYYALMIDWIRDILRERKR